MSDTIEMLFVFDDPITKDAVSDALAYCDERADSPKWDWGLDTEDYMSVAEGMVAEDNLVPFKVGDDSVTFDYRMGVNRSKHSERPHVVLFVPDIYFRSGADGLTNEDVREASETVYSMVRELYTILRGADHAVEAVLVIDRSDIEQFRRNGPCPYFEADVPVSESFDRLAWMQMFPPAVADRIGRDRLASAPAWKVGPLDDGSVLLAIDWAPTNMINDEYDIGAVADHLDMRA